MPKMAIKSQKLSKLTSIDVKNKTHARRSRTAENIAVAAESVEENPDLGLKAYKVQLIQELKPADHQQRRVFAYWVVEMHENDLEFHRKIILTDEAHFHLGGFVKKIWGSENPRVIVEKPLYPQRVTVWCGL
ncbi:uncharacterized protein LOC128855555 [Anastrepha ludens]|uniref:uncharacterized protein LOC128855555 n=1 Tax=Anastrepha ludens TaxID=28586 RepID=UPI0023B04E3C|nr:uncharacterized protein LOC128855555 [Anastrepha ludens]